MEDEAAREQVARVETLLEEIEALPDSGARDRATEMVAALLDLYGEGLGRILAHAMDAGGEGLPEALADDELVSHLLFLHDLHPVPVEDRVRGALAEVRPYLESHGGDVELLGVEEGTVRLRLNGSCDGCPSSAMTLKLAIEDAVHKAAPDIEEVVAEGAAEAESAEPKSNLIQLEVADSLRVEQVPAAGSGDGDGWATAGSLPELGAESTVVKRVAGEDVLFLKLDATPYAYRPECPGCRESLADAALEGEELVCSECGNRYDVRRAGRCLDQPELYIEPVPLLATDSGLVKVAVGSAVG
ncbi:MAG TPA: NifU family protein [Thermoleophilaceae bacterium]|nr:NifU family protein [Thermoleophilaceae bacterium]